MELIVTTIIIGIMMVGIAAVDVALRQTERGTSANSIVVMRTSAIMLHISKSVEVATGDGRTDAGGTPINLGIIFSTVDANRPSLWVRRENPANPNPDPNTYDDDVWVGYTLKIADNTLYYCVTPDDPSPGPTPSTPCDGVAGRLNLGALTGFTASLITDSATQTFYLETTLTNRLDPNAAADTFDNPEHILTSRISPASSSF